jgi:hypothetical protein
MDRSKETTYLARRVAFLTQHGKQDLVKAPLESALGCELVHTDAYDTDQLGTYTREIARPGSQLDAARRKAQIGMTLTGAPAGLASEGSFGTDPFGGFMPWNTELLLWADPAHQLEVTGIAHGPAQSLHRTVNSLDELMRFAQDAKFPEHHLVMRPEHEDHLQIVKNIHDEQTLVRTFTQLQAESANGLVFVENDLRAFCNPTRQALIRKACDDLILKLRSACPQCQSPGFWVQSRTAGLPCSACGQKTRLPIAEVWHCKPCQHEEQRPLASEAWADPSRCDFCNP